jgi:hypothetical protein
MKCSRPASSASVALHRRAVERRKRHNLNRGLHNDQALVLRAGGQQGLLAVKTRRSGWYGREACDILAVRGRPGLERHLSRCPAGFASLFYPRRPAFLPADELKHFQALLLAFDEMRAAFDELKAVSRRGKDLFTDEGNSFGVGIDSLAQAF